MVCHGDADVDRHAVVSKRATTTRATEPLHKKSAAPATVLLVDDEAAVRNLAAKFLSMKGYRVLTANDCDQARRLWRDHKDEIDLLLTDVVMIGRRDGHQLAAEFQGGRSGLKVLFTSGYDFPPAGTDVSLTRAGFIPKPYRPDQLLAAVEAALSGREPHTMESYGEDPVS
jgi:two-component system cell cycle sensor histidine kinase/response regulator CckA